MYNLHEVTRAILQYENKEFGNEFTFTQIKEMDEMSENNISYKDNSYVEYPYTNFHYEVIGKHDFENYWEDRIIDLADDCYLHNISDFMKRYFDYDKFCEDVKEEGRAAFFNGYDGRAELETENYYIYLWNQNYDIKKN